MLNAVYFLELAAHIIAVSLCCFVAVAHSCLAVDQWRKCRRLAGREPGTPGHGAEHPGLWAGPAGRAYGAARRLLLTVFGARVALRRHHERREGRGRKG